MALADIEDTLRWATFDRGLAVIGTTDPTMPPSLGIVVNAGLDDDLARLFALRERLADDEFLAQWEVSAATVARVVLDPTSPQALLRYGVPIERPQQIERRFLFLVHALAPQLASLAHPGTDLWLIPQRVAEGRAPTETAVGDLLSHCLPLGTISKSIPALDLALTHVGYRPGHRGVAAPGAP